MFSALLLDVTPPAISSSEDPSRPNWLASVRVYTQLGLYGFVGTASSWSPSPFRTQIWQYLQYDVSRSVGGSVEWLWFHQRSIHKWRSPWQTKEWAVWERIQRRRSVSDFSFKPRRDRWGRPGALTANKMWYIRFGDCLIIERLRNPVRKDFHTGYGMFSLWFNELWVIVHWITMKTCFIRYENACVRGPAPSGPQDPKDVLQVLHRDSIHKIANTLVKRGPGWKPTAYYIYIHPDLSHFVQGMDGKLA